MAATLHAKMNRKKLNKLNIIKICEEILNPSVPMALRLSGILMDDVTRLLVEINEAWKIKAAPDPTVLPKGKLQAKKEAVTLPEKNETDFGEVENSHNFSIDAPTMGFQHTAYFAMIRKSGSRTQSQMRLDDVDEPYVGNDGGEGDPFQDSHQADAENITLFERFDLHQGNTDMYNRFERFDIEGDEETQVNFTSGEHTQKPTSHMPSPPHQDEPLRADEILDQHPEHQVNPQSDESKEARQDQQMQSAPKRKTRKRPAASAMDYEQTIIPNHLYQSWLKNTSDIVSRGGRKRKASSNLLSTTKIANLMELPPLVLIDDLFTKENRAIYYPDALLELWTKSTQPPHDSPSARTSPPQPPEPSLSSPQETVHYQEPARFPFVDIHSGVGSDPVSREMIVEHLVNNDQIVMEEVTANFLNNNIGASNLMVTPDDVRFNPSSGSGHRILSNSSEVHSGRSNQKGPRSFSRHGSSGLESVAEENRSGFSDPNYQLSNLSESDLAHDQELLVETGPTQTQPRPPISNPQVDKMTDSIRTQMKMHFETPGAPEIESLHKLAAGLKRKGAAVLFYQTCVLASRDELRVEQKVPYGDILLSKGSKM
ncbi:hypothetical protein EZV62_025953 [Acer yangbiense]|uniref:Rad21/Rec8-like protein C-terminal eukaryotic domain-containing protein n=1 Tax=Acer yangbiense TaxID=1000413 RepID=A0A5C7GZ90_9ROSI|nr:hypothetical protein EZV62_025953 [Acer yangbiense]